MVVAVFDLGRCGCRDCVRLAVCKAKVHSLVNPGSEMTQPGAAATPWTHACWNRSVRSLIRLGGPRSIAVGPPGAVGADIHAVDSWAA